VLLEVDHIQADYGDVVALHDVSFAVAEGEVVSIIGSNGAGKSTTLRTISGQLRPTRGSISFRGQRIGGLPAHRIAELGVAHVPEGRKLFSRLRVMENLLVGSYSARARAEEQATIERVFEMFPQLRERASPDAAACAAHAERAIARPRPEAGRRDLRHDPRYRR
jgi:branched-chain amino acid transport system ATP-binding protein